MFGGGLSQRTRLKNTDVDGLYKKLSTKFQLPEGEAIHYDLFKHGEDGELYYRGLRKSLTYDNGKLRMVDVLESTLGKNRLCSLGFEVPNRPTAKQAAVLNKAHEEMHSTSDIARADDIELQEIVRATSKAWRI